MAKSKLTADIPGVGVIEVDGNHATEESIQQLIAAMENREKISSREVENFNNSVGDAADEIDEFSDTIEESGKRHDKVAKKLASFADTSTDATMGLQKFADSGGSLSSVIDSVGDVIIGVGRGLGGMVPFVGEGLEELTGAAATATVGLTSMAVSMIEGFQGLNKQIFNSGLQIQGGFSRFADFANDAGLPINEFANSMLLSSNRLRLFAGAAPGGIQQVSKALKNLTDDGIMGNLYSLGFTTEEVVAGMADFAIAAERQGRSLSTEELAAGSEQYLKNLRELGRLTGTSVKEAQAQIEADRSNLFVQRELLKVAPGQRAAAASFAAQLDALGLGPMKDFIIAGQSMSTESGIMSSQMSSTATVLRNAYEQIANGNVETENVSAFLRDSLRNNSVVIDQELENLINTFGLTPKLSQDFGELGTATRGVTEMINAARTDMSGGTEIEPDSVQDNLGKFEETLNAAQASIQNVFVESLDGVSPLLSKLATSADSAATNLNEFVDAFADGELNEYFAKVKEDIADDLDLDAGNLAREAAKEVAKSELNRSGARGQNLNETDFSSLSSRFLENPDSLTREETQDLINTLRSKGREDSNALVKSLGFLSGSMSDWFGNLDARLVSDEYIRQSIEALRNSESTDGYATGGVASGPTSGYDVELHGTEAVVPLPDGNSIPVDLNTPTVNLSGIGNILGSLMISNMKMPDTENIPGSLMISDMEMPDTENIPGSLMISDMEMPDTENIPGSLDINNVTNTDDTVIDNFLKMLSGISENLIAVAEIHSPDKGFSVSGINSILGEIANIVSNNTNETEDNDDSLVNMTTSLDSSKTLNEMLKVNKNMLQQMMSSSQKTDQMLRAMENANLISRNTAYTRA